MEDSFSLGSDSELTESDNDSLMTDTEEVMMKIKYFEVLRDIHNINYYNYSSWHLYREKQDIHETEIVYLGDRIDNYYDMIEVR